MSETNTPKVTGTKVGIVTSAKRDKTRTVAVEYQKVHAKYGKRLRREAKFQVHDESNDSGEGDRVEIAQCRPLSKTKSWRLVRVLERAPEDVAHKVEAPTAD
jgi:small subunit ribosomal protein S17